jgi:hypothetical protein
MTMSVPLLADSRIHILEHVQRGADWRRISIVAARRTWRAGSLTEKIAKRNIFLDFDFLSLLFRHCGRLLSQLVVVYIASSI